jgi:hypothetical protein
MKTNRSMSQKQIDYIVFLKEQIDDKKIIFNLPEVFKNKVMSETAASKLIFEMKEKLGKEIVDTLSQPQKWKSLSNIFIKPEWIIDPNYKSNSILVAIPFTSQDGEEKLLECRFPKGDREVTKWCEKTNSEVAKKVGKMIFQMKEERLYNKKIKNDYIACGIKLSWLGWFRFITYYNNKTDISEKLCTKWSDNLDIFETINNNYVTEYKKVTNAIVEAFYEMRRRKQKLDAENAAKGKLHDVEAKITSHDLSEYELKLLADYEKEIHVQEPPNDHDEIAIYDDDAILFED